MKVFFLVNSISGGGAERVAFSLADGFSKKGISSYLIVINSEVNIRFLENSGVRVIKLYNGKKLAGIRKILKMPILAIRLNRVLQEANFNPKEDLFTSHLPFSNYVAWMAQVSEHFAVIHNTYSKLYSRELLHPFLVKIHERKKLIFVSKGIKTDFYIHFNPKLTQCFQIYNPFDFNSIRLLSQEKMSIEPGRFIIHIGRFTYAKRHDILLDSFSRLSNLNLKLLLLGDGELKDEIDLSIKSMGLENRVIQLGWIDNPFPYIKNADLLLLTSDFEGLGNVLIESLILKTPIISTDCPYGPSEILIDELRDYLVPVNSPVEIANKIEQALIDYPRISDELIQKFSIEVILEKYAKLKESNFEEL